MGNKLNNCSQKRFDKQNDGNNWIVDEKNQPIELLDKVAFEKKGLEAPTPDMIPAEKTSRTINWVKLKEEEKTGLSIVLADGGEAAIIQPKAGK